MNDCQRELNMDFIDGKYKLSDEDKREVFYLFNPEESCDFTTKEYYYTEFWELNEKFCQVCVVPTLIRAKIS